MIRVWLIDRWTHAKDYATLKRLIDRSTRWLINWLSFIRLRCYSCGADRPMSRWGSECHSFVRYRLTDWPERGLIVRPINQLLLSTPMVQYNLFTRSFDLRFLNDAMWFVCRTDWPMVLYNLYTRPFDRWLCIIYKFFRPCPMDLRTGFGRLTDGTYSTRAPQPWAMV